jgi:hypothetical protein
MAANRRESGVHPREIYGDPTRSPTAKLQLNDSVQRRPRPAVDGAGLWLHQPVLRPGAEPEGLDLRVNGAFGPGPRRCITQISGRPADLNLGWNFRTKEGVSLQIPAEFVSIFNRTQIGNPSTSNPLGGPIQDKSSGKYIGGFS